MKKVFAAAIGFVFVVGTVFAQTGGTTSPEDKKGKAGKKGHKGGKKGKKGGDNTTTPPK